MRGLRLLVPVLVAALLSGCADFAPGRLYDDQIGYSRVLSESQKAQTLLNIVRIRYGDSPVFLNTTQVISGYSLQSSLGGALNIASSNAAATTFATTPSVSVSQTPTFTFQPVTGQELAQSIIRPLSPAELLPLSLSGTPIDVLFRLTVQSVNGLQNSSPLDVNNRAGEEGFYRLLINLRRLQVAGLLDVRLDAAVENQPARLILIIRDSPDPDQQPMVAETRRLLGIEPGREQAEVVYGGGRASRGQVAILTRPILGVLGQVGSEVEVAPGDVARHLTIPTVDDAKVLTRPTVVVHSGDKAPDDVFVSALYHRRWYWIDSADFDSKVAFSVVQLLLTLAQTTPPTNTVVTIPGH